MQDCIWLKNGLYLNPTDKHTNRSSMSVTACCRSKHNYSTLKQIPSDIVNSATPSPSIHHHLEQIKNPKYNYENVKDTVCRTCTDAERTTGQSMRTIFNKVYQKAPAGKITLMHIAFGNFCNFSCRYCSATNSTSWNKDADTIKQIYQDPNYKEEKFHDMAETFMTERETYNHELQVIRELEQQDLSHLQYVGVNSSGEPFMARHWQQFVELLDSKTDLSKVLIQINSNFSTFPKPHIIDLLKKFRRVDLRISIEATGPLAEYIRQGLKFEKFETNIKKWQEVAKDYPNITLTPHMTNSVYNINKIVEFEEWASDMKILTDGIKPAFISFVYRPEHLDMRRVLNNKQLDECHTKLNSVKTGIIRTSLQRFIADRSYQDKQPEVLQQFKTYNRMIDKIRTQKLQDVNLELHNWIYEK